MTSKLVVNTIEADTGISSVSFASSISLSSTSVFHLGDAGFNIGADTNINRPGNGVIGFNINDSEKARINSSGRMGLGTVSPDTTLTVQSGGDAQMSLKNPSGTTKAYVGTAGAFGSAGTDDLRIRSDSSNIVFGFSGTERLRITSGGNLLVGKTTTSFTEAGVRMDSDGAIMSIRTSTSTNQATANGGSISLVNYSATDNNFSHIAGYNSNSLVTSQINFVNTSHSSRTGDITFRTHNGSSMDERLRIGSSGQIGLSGANYGTAGQVLTSQGAGSAPTWAAAGGITHARVYRLLNTADASGGTQTLTSWEYSDDASSGHLGSGWSLPSNGEFSFPATGIYDISVMGMMRQLNNSNAWCGIQGQVTINNGGLFDSVFTSYQQIVQASGSSNQYVNIYGHCMIDVTNTSNVRFKLTFFADQNEQVYLHGASDENLTAIKITRLGDT